MKLYKILTLTAFLSLTSCNYFMTGIPAERITSPGKNPNILSDDAMEKLTSDQVTYAFVKANVMDVSCTKCHYSGEVNGKKGKRPDLSTETALKAVLSPVKDAVIFGEMPPVNKEGIVQFPISVAQKNLLIKWIEKTEKENLAQQPPQPIPTPVPTPPPANEILTDDAIEKMIQSNPNQITYAVVKTNVMDVSCAKCHNPVDAEFPDLSTEKNLLDSLDMAKGAVEEGWMPQSKYPLTDSQKKLFMAWFEKIKNPPAEQPPEAAPVPQPETPAPVVAPKELTDDEITALKDSDLNYALVNKNVFEPNCINCHSSTAKRPRPPYMDSYANVINNKQKLFGVFGPNAIRPMPPRGMAEARKQMVIRWLSLGAPLAVSPTQVIVPQK